jgi:RNA polymerase sigma-70 factor (ECF subfamily)
MFDRRGHTPTPTTSTPLADDSSSNRALAEVFDRHRQRLRTVIELRMDPRLKSRVDPSDVLQETYLDAAARWEKYEKETPAAPYFWLRFLAVQRLMILHRRHLLAQNRDARREVPIPPDAAVEVSSCGFAGAILDSGTSPSRAMSRAEAEEELQRVLAGLDANDREILALRHFEHLSNAEAAELLRITTGSASQRYYRALRRLRDALAAVGGGIGEVAR